MNQTMQIFAELFEAVSGNRPFPWQEALYSRFVAGRIPNSAAIPTGLGKTSVVTIWLLALAEQPDRVPRRLVYVVNRRTVVDQTTDEVVRLRKALAKPGLAPLEARLSALVALPCESPLAISTLRGQYADNGEWRTDPARPAVIIGTVDMIGSGLLFNRYTAGFKSRPFHAALLGQDALLIHDEAHLEPAFQHLLDEVVDAQVAANDPRKLRVMALSATQRSKFAEPFELSDDDHRNATISKRYHAVKRLVPDAVEKDGDVRDRILEFALAAKDTGRAVLIFVRSVESAEKIAADLASKRCSVATLTGTMRGKERDGLVDSPIFQRFLRAQGPTDKAARQTVYLVATSAGEVGVNLSADDLICDLSTFDSMAQRFGRVNRFGDCTNSVVTVVYAKDIQQMYDEGLRKAGSAGKDAEKRVKTFKERNRITVSLINTLAILKRLDSANSASLAAVPASEREAAFSPLPKFREATDIQFDAWALTSIVKPIAARPAVAPYLHGEAEWEPPATHVAWREEADLICGIPPEELLDDWPLKPHELLRDRTERVYDRLLELVDAKATVGPAWLIRENGALELFPLTRLLSDVAVAGGDTDEDPDSEEGDGDAPSAKVETDAAKRRKSRICATLAGSTLVLPASLGGLSPQGLLDPKGGNTEVDVSETETRKRIRSAEPSRTIAGFRCLRSIDTLAHVDEVPDQAPDDRYWLWYEAREGTSVRSDDGAPVTLADHTAATVAHAFAIARKLNLEEDVVAEIADAARGHDLGKNRRRWQRGIGNNNYDPAVPATIVAKPGAGMRPLHIAEDYRHEFGSIREVRSSGLSAHIIAAHHGRARPHFPTDEVFDPESDQADCIVLAAEVPRRFAALQARYGRWGLAWLESILRAADYAASAGIVPSPVALDGPSWRSPHASQATPVCSVATGVAPSFSIRLDPANPGHYFACCGLFELAARLHPETTAWFASEGTTFHVSAGDLTLADLLAKATAAPISAVDPGDRAKTPLVLGKPFHLRLDWWRHEDSSVGKLKPWAGNTSVLSMAQDMQATLGTEVGRLTADGDQLLGILSTANRYEPFYFDPHRAVNATAIDIGFSPDKLSKAAIAISPAVHPAVEFFCPIGLQRGRPRLLPSAPGTERMYAYSLWSHPLPVTILPVAVAGMIPDCMGSFSFTNPSRTKDYRAFLPAKRT